ncbi:MAG: chorismate mutase [Polyangiaceae bacterium]
MSDQPAPAGTLASMRAAIDAEDRALIELLARRRALVRELFEWKLRHGLPLIDPAREALLLADRAALAEERGLPASLVERVLRTILDASHADAAENLARPPDLG